MENLTAQTAALEQHGDIMKDCFLRTKSCLHMHVHLALTRKDEYVGTILDLCQYGLIGSTVSQATRARMIAALHIVGENRPLQTLLQHSEVVEITKALSILDRPRLIRQLQNEIAVIEEAHTHLRAPMEEKTVAFRHRRGPSGHHRKGRRRRSAQDSGELQEPTKRRRKRKIDVLRRRLKDLQAQQADLNPGAHGNSAVQELIDSSSVSGALGRKIRHWAKYNLKSDFLEFVILAMPMDNWKRLADLVHFNPGDFSLPYFLRAAHGERPPADSFVHGMQSLINSASSGVGDRELSKEFSRLATDHPQVYQSFNFLRTQPQLLRSRKICAMLSRHVPLGTAVWYLEELAQSSEELAPSSKSRRGNRDDVPGIIRDRMLADPDWWRKEDGPSSKVASSYGKLLERMLTFQQRKWHDLASALMPVAERRLGALREMWSDRGNHDEERAMTAVFGDASGSMQSAIEAATILATMVSVCWDGELCFFNAGYLKSPHPRPTTVEHTLEVCKAIRARGSTCLAAALWPYYFERRKIHRIVLVTDEEENSDYHRYDFASMLKAYKDEVYDGVELIIISVDSPKLREKLKKLGLEFRERLTNLGIEYKRIEIDGRRPDLTKFDGMLGQIAMVSKHGKMRSNNDDDNGTVEEEEGLTDSVMVVEDSRDTSDDDFALHQQAGKPAGPVEADHKRNMAKLAEVRKRREQAEAKRKQEEEVAKQMEEERKKFAAMTTAEDDGDKDGKKKKKESKDADIPRLGKVAIKSMKPAQMKEALKVRGLDIQGNAKTLQERLLKYEADSVDDDFVLVDDYEILADD